MKDGLIQVACVTPPLRVADCTYNAEQIVSAFQKAAADGAKLAFKEINANGGVLGKQIKVITADNKGEPSESANAMTKVITQDKVIAVTGFTVSSCGIAASCAD